MNNARSLPALSWDRLFVRTYHPAHDCGHSANLTTAVHQTGTNLTNILDAMRIARLKFPQPLALLAALLAASFIDAFAVLAGDTMLYEQRLLPYPFQITLPATIDWKVYPFALDTGTHMNAFDPSLKSLLGKSTGGVRLDTGRGLTMSEKFSSPAFKIGKFSPMSVEGVLLHCHPFQSVLGFDSRGLIGSGAFRQQAIWLDFDHQSLKILESVHAESDGMSQSPVVYPYADLIPCIEERILSQTLRMIIDTGRNSDIGITHDVFAQFVADGTIIEDTREIANDNTAAGARNTIEAHFAKGKLLGIDLKGMLVTDTGDSSQFGMDFLSNFNCILDLGAGVFYYRPRQTLPPIRVRKMLGAVVNFPEGRNVVIQLDPEGGASQDAGIRVGDHFVRMGPIGAAALNAISIYELCLKHAGETIKVELARPGLDRSITAKLKLPKLIFEYPPRTR